VPEKYPLFACLTLTDDELMLYEQLYQHMRPQAVRPDLAIYGGYIAGTHPKMWHDNVNSDSS
jgi:hypothetical protein